MICRLIPMDRKRQINTDNIISSPNNEVNSAHNEVNSAHNKV